MSSSDCLFSSVLLCRVHHLCREAEYDADIKLLVAITAVFDAQGMASQSAAAAATAGQHESGENSDSDEQKAARLNKKQRRGSGSSATERAAEQFAKAMDRLAPPAGGSKEWFASCMINDEQRAKIVSQLPAGEISCLMLATFDDDDLAAAGLVPKQIKAWKHIASTYKPAF